MLFSWGMKPIEFVILMCLVLPGSACNWSPSPDTMASSPPPEGRTLPNAQDFKIANQALNLEDVLVRLRGGDSQQTIIREVKTRHITAAIAEEAERQLSKNGARPELLQELKDAPSYTVAPRNAGVARELNMTTHGWHYDSKGHKVPNAETW
jgi:hypothetical protein